MKRDLTPQEKSVLMNKGTERPRTGKYNKFNEKGTFSCRNCGADLYKSESKFDAHCGWPAFDDEIEGAVKRVPDADGRRTEIVCNHCQAHLGHVFTGEQLTEKNVRHCVNSICLDFTPAKWTEKYAYVAGGCFWGVEYYLEQLPGVISAESGYSGGSKENPTYKEVCSGKSGHIEAVKITYNPHKISYREIVKRFFEIHDPSQKDGQGPDIGPQYLSAIFYNSEDEKKVTQELIKLLEKKKIDVATKLIKFDKFWPAEAYHQDYYEKKGALPYCHGYTKRF